VTGVENISVSLYMTGHHKSHIN